MALVRMKKAPVIISILVLFFHGVMAWHATKRLSPTWDEISYPAAGYAQLKTGAIHFVTGAPFLSHLIFATPLLFLNPEVPVEGKNHFGFDFIFRNTVPAHSLIFWSRLPAIFISVLMGAFLFWWMRRLKGEAAALITLAMYVSVPIFISRSSLALMEMPMFFFILLALWFNSKGRLIPAGLATGAALLCKLTALPLVPALVLFNFFFHPKRALSFAIFIGTVFVTILLAYAPWQGAGAGLLDMTRSLFTVDKSVPYYWAGRTYQEAPSLLSWAAFFIKAPLLLLALSGVGAFLWWRSKDNRAELIQALLLTGCSLGAVLFFKNAVTTVQLSPAYIGFVLCAGGLSLIQKRRSILIILLGLVLVEPRLAHPNTLSYFNWTVGGSKNGYKWLQDSDQDWGQALPQLADYLRENNISNVVLSYSGAADPRAYGIFYQDLFSPALVSREQNQGLLLAGATPVYVVVGTKVLQSYPQAVGWFFEHMEPVTLVGNCFFVFDVTETPEAFKWMERVYVEVGRADRAQWARRYYT